MLFNPQDADVTFMLPRRRFGAQWLLELSTADPDAEAGSARFGARTEVPVPAHSMLVLKRA
jgi:hypothetical protein